MKFRRKPIIIKAIRWTGKEFNELVKFLDKNDWSWNCEENQLKVNSVEVGSDEYIVKNPDGSTNVLSELCFFESYEEV